MNQTYSNRLMLFQVTQAALGLPLSGAVLANFKIHMEIYIKVKEKVWVLVIALLTRLEQQCFTKSRKWQLIGMS